MLHPISVFPPQSILTSPPPEIGRVVVALRGFGAFKRGFEHLDVGAIDHDLHLAFPSGHSVLDDLVLSAPSFENQAFAGCFPAQRST
jgi:hypothetical protein